MKRILITGASGFVGSFIIEEALKNNFEVYAGVRKTSNRRYLSHPGIAFITLDFSNKKALKDLLLKTPRFDYIVHVAGIIKTCRKDQFDTVNYRYTRNFIEALTETQRVPDKFLFISSLAAMGPGDEKSLKPVTLNDKPHPISFYAKSKLKAEQFILSQKNFPYLILRPTGIYGPREKDYYLAYKSIQQHIETYIGSKEQHLTFLHVIDLARLVITALESKIVNKTYFVTDLKYYTAEQFNMLIKKILNKKTLTIVFPKFFVQMVVAINETISCLLGKPVTLNRDKYHELICKNWLCEADETAKDFEFTPQYDLEKGLRQTIAWFKKERML